MLSFTLTLLILCINMSQLEGIQAADKTVLPGDLPYIGCDVCLKAMSEIYDSVQEARHGAPYGKLTEAAVFEVVEKVCESDGKGQWMRRIDIVEYKENGKKYLTFDEPGGASTCGRECGTIEKSCKNLFDEEIDQDELTVLLWQNKFKSLEELQDKACRKLTKRCKNGVKNAPIKNKSKRVDFPFNLITEREMEMEKMLANMKASGTGGTLLSTAEMQDMNRGDEEDDDPNYIRGETIDSDGNTRINF